MLRLLADYIDGIHPWPVAAQNARGMPGRGPQLLQFILYIVVSVIKWVLGGGGRVFYSFIGFTKKKFVYIFSISKFSCSQWAQRLQLPTRKKDT